MASSRLLKTVSGVEWNIGMWKLERNPTFPTLYQASNLVNSGSLPRTADRFLDGIPTEMWDNEGFLVVLPSQETIGWLNRGAKGWRVAFQEESEGV